MRFNLFIYDHEITILLTALTSMKEEVKNREVKNILQSIKNRVYYMQDKMIKLSEK